MHSSWIIAGYKGYVSHIERAMRGVVWHTFAQIWLHQIHGEVNILLASCCVGSECDILLIESEITFIAQSFADALALFVEQIAVEQRILLHQKQCRVSQNQFSKGVVGNIIRNRRHVMGLAKTYIIGHLHAFFVEIAHRVNGYRRVHVAFVGQCR